METRTKQAYDLAHKDLHVVATVTTQDN